MKNLSQRISQRVRASRSSRIARNLAAFLAQRDEIRNAIDDGWTLYQIWETLHAEQKVAMSYGTFCSQVKRLIIQRKPAVQAALAVHPDPGRPPANPGGRVSLPSPAGPAWAGGAAATEWRRPAAASSRAGPLSSSTSAARAHSGLSAGFIFSSTPNDEDIL